MNITKKTSPNPEYFLDRSYDDEDRDASVVELSTQDAIDSLGFGRFQYLLLFVLSWNFLNTSFQYILPGILLPTFFKEFELESFDLSIYGFFEYFAYLTGAFLSYYFSEKFGRRKIILLTLIFPAILTAICCLAQTIFMVILIRFLSINCLVINYYFSFAFMMELLPRSFKKHITLYLQLTHSLGIILCILLVYWVFDNLDYGNWHILMIFSSILIWIAFALNALILNESPYYNMKKGNFELAYLVINRIAKFNLKNPDYLTLEKKRNLSQWFIQNESIFNLAKKEENNEKNFNFSMIFVWSIDLFIYHGFDFILPIFLVLQKNEIHPLFQNEKLLDYLVLMHLISNIYLVLISCFNRINFKRKIFVLITQLCNIIVALFLGFNMAPSFFFWMVIFKLFLNSYNYFKLQIICDIEEEKKVGISLKNLKLYAKLGMICSTFLLVFFININIYVIYFIFSGLFLVNFILWSGFQDSFLFREEIWNKDMRSPLNKTNENRYEYRYKIIEIPI